MSYPEEIYKGNRGLINAVLRPNSEPSDVSYPSGGTAHYLETGQTTGGQFGLYRWDMAATPVGADPHFHRSISESFYVLSGSVRLYDGEGCRDGHPRDFLYIPEGDISRVQQRIRSARLDADSVCSGCAREDYFETLAKVATGRSMADEEKAEFFLRHDTFWAD